MYDSRARVTEWRRDADQDDLAVSPASSTAVVNRIRPLVKPSRNRSGATPETVSSPRSSSATRTGSTSIPTTPNPSPAAAQASETPT